MSVQCIFCTSDGFYYKVWLSLDNQLDPEFDLELRHWKVEKTFTSTVSNELLKTGSDPGFLIPAELPETFCGNVYLLLQVDPSDFVKESDELESNNVAAGKLQIVCNNGKSLL